MRWRMRLGQNLEQLGTKSEIVLASKEGNTMSMWKECLLSDLGTIVGGATPSTKDPANYEDGTIPWITPKDLSDFHGRYISRGERLITQKGLESCSTQMMPAHSVLFSSRAPIGYIAIASNELCTNQGFKSVVPNKDTDYLFLYYLLRYNKDAIEHLGSGTTFKEVSGSTMRNVQIRVPTLLEDQKKIAAILGSIDDKIELNNRINENLEQQLLSVFKNCFAEDISNVSHSDCPVLGDLVAIIDNRGKTPPLTTDIFDFPIIDVGALKGRGRIIEYDNCTKYVSENTYKEWFRNGHPQKWDILLSTVGSIAEMKIFLGNKGCIAQNVVALRPIQISPLYLYQYLLYIRDDLIAYNIGSVQPSIKVTHIIKHPIYIPNKQQIKKFDDIARPLTNLMYNNYSENEKLKAIRDSLLPRLMSGELDVSKVKL